MQNAAGFIATESVKLTAENHLHLETKMLSVQDHLSLLTSQFLATRLQPGHASYPTVTVDPGPRDMKTTLQRRFGMAVLRFFIDWAVTDAKEARKQLHTDYVHSSLQARPLNWVVKLQPPDIAE